MGSPTRVEDSFESGSPHPGLTRFIGRPFRIMQRLLFWGCCWPLWPHYLMALWLLAVEGLCGICLLLHCLGVKSGWSLEVTFEQRQVHFITGQKLQGSFRRGTLAAETSHNRGAADATLDHRHWGSDLPTSLWLSHWSRGW